LPKDSFYDLDLFKHFSLKNYAIKTAKVVLDKKTSKGLGHGYLVFFKQEEADRCLKEMNNSLISGHAIILSMKSQVKNFNEKANVIVKNIDKLVT
jgi:RNA recognition motif-containing protein